MPSKSYAGLESVFQSGGLLEASSESYEHRASQKDMAFAVLDALENDKFALIDAPTGIGKSLAYLIPSMLYSSQSGERVVIATDTNALLWQLVNKDAPFADKIVSKLLKEHINFSYIQGKSKYICYSRYKKFIEFYATGLFSTYELKRDEFEYLVKFHSLSKYASFDELDYNYQNISKLWGEINISSDSPCTDCPYKGSECRYYSTLLKRVYASNVIITNHSLLLSDALIRLKDENITGSSAWDDTVVLPSFSKLIIDEAHNLVRNCENSFSVSYSTRDVNLSLLHLISRENNLFTALLNSLSSTSPLSKEHEFYNPQKAAKLSSVSDMLLKLNKKLFEDVAGIFNSRINYKECSIDELRLSQDTKNTIDEIISQSTILYSEFSSVKRSGCSTSIYDDISMTINSIRENSSALEKTVNKLKVFDSDTMHWVEFSKNQSGGVVEFKAMPIFAGENLEKLLYKNLTSCVLTSATLDSGDDFGFYIRTAGLQDNKDRQVERMIFDSSFDYRANTMQIFTNDIATSQSSEDSYDKTSRLISSAIKISNGGALILFTSFQALNEVYSRVKALHKSENIELLTQGSGESNSSLMRKFRNDKDSVLFATSSFWEGVDFSGDTLRLLVLHKIPFSVPSTPLHQARDAVLREKGRNIFREYDVPEAVVKMRQGCGRLMRKASDRGVIVVLDNRVANNPYYKEKFFDVLNKDNSYILSSGDAISSIKEFFR